ncbi:MAG: adenine deaminase [Deltaproteobacteria bacterium]|nr:adenine deaminase [Deltaproteobacteria bacterium]
MDWKKIAAYLEVARGDRPADLVLSGGRVANLYTKEWLAQDVAIVDGVIAGLGDYPGPRLDLNGAYLLPGFIDGHLHLESSLLTPGELARALLVRGATTVVADPHEICSVWGVQGLEYMFAATTGLPVDFFFLLPSCVPASPLGTAGATLTAADLAPYRDHPRVLGLAEVMNFPGVVAGQADLLEKIGMFRRRVVDGHAPLLSGKGLNAYRLTGIGSDHECTQALEALEKLRLGFYLMVREGSLAKNLAELLPAVPPAGLRRTLLVSDDCQPQDLLQRGHLDHLLRQAVGLGLDPLEAVGLVTLNPAEYFRLRDRGALAPGMLADLVAVHDLREMVVDRVWKRGRLMVQEGRLLDDLHAPSPPLPVTSWEIRDLTPEDLSPPAESEVVKVIGLVPGQLLTEKLLLPTPVRHGRLAAAPERDLLKAMVLERHRGTGNLGLGLVRGFGLQKGAIASTVAHDCHNLVVVGASEADMLTAASHLANLGGGLAVVAEGEVLADLPLPIAGLLSPAPLAEVADACHNLNAAYQSLGGALTEPFMALSFLPLEVIPALKLTDLGLVDVERFQSVSLFGPF